MRVRYIGFFSNHASHREAIRTVRENNLADNAFPGNHESTIDARNEPVKNRT
jgi:hypothetical protein